MRQEGAFKRDRAIAYALAQKVTRLTFDDILVSYYIDPISGKSMLSNFLDNACICGSGNQMVMQIPDHLGQRPLSSRMSLTKTAGTGAG